MGLVSVDTLNEGSVLAEDVHDINGRLLLREGQEISAKHLRVLKIWGITEVEVVGESDDDESAVAVADPEKQAAVEAAMKILFSRLDLTHDAIAYVHACAVTHRYTHNLIPSFEEQGDVSTPPPSRLDGKAIQRKIDDKRLKLPEAPTIVVKLNQVMADPHASANDVAQIVGTSASLTALMLRIVNSAAFGLPTKVDRISRAVALLGTREISALAMGVSVVKAFMDIPRDLIDMDTFLSHSLACATVTRYLAALSNHSQTEQLFIAGLLHDIGKLILFKYFPQEVQALFQAAGGKEDGRPLHDVEKELIGRTHAQIGAYLLKKWNFPEQIRNIVAHHHSAGHTHAPSETVIVQMADIITNAIGFGSSGERIIPGFDAAAWDRMGLAASGLKTAIRQGAQQLRAMETILSAIGSR